MIYSEFNLAAIIAAKAEGIPVVGSVSYPTQAAYANAKRKAQGINRVLSEVGLPRAGTALNLFTWLDFRFVPSCYELEPMEGPNLAFCGFLDAIAPVQTPDSPTDGQRNVLVFYLGTGTVPRKRLYRAVCEIADAVSYELYVAGVDESDAPASAKNRKNLHFGKRFDFSELLPCAIAFVNHGGQNSVMTALEYGVPQIIYPGKVFERQYNAQSIVDAGAGISLADFTSESVSGAIEKLRCDTSLARNASALRETLSSLGGTSCIISHTEELVANRIVKKLFPQRISLD